MAGLEPRYSQEAFAQRGQTIDARDIRLHLGSEDHGTFVAIDIETGAYEIDRDDYTATERFLSEFCLPHAVNSSLCCRSLVKRNKGSSN